MTQPPTLTTNSRLQSSSCCWRWWRWSCRLVKSVCIVRFLRSQMISTKKHVSISVHIYLQYSRWLLTSISLVNPRTSEVSETPRLPSLDALFGWPGKYGYRCHEYHLLEQTNVLAKNIRTCCELSMLFEIYQSYHSKQKYCIMTLEETHTAIHFNLCDGVSTRTGTMCVHVVIMYTLVM